MRNNGTAYTNFTSTSPLRPLFHLSAVLTENFCDFPLWKPLSFTKEGGKKKCFLPFLEGEQFHYHGKDTELFKVHIDFIFKSFIYCLLFLFMVLL